MLFRYKPDNVLISDTFINASRFAAVAARKLNRDAKAESLDYTHMHALLQVISYTSMHAACHAAHAVLSFCMHSVKCCDASLCCACG